MKKEANKYSVILASCFFCVCVSAMAQEKSEKERFQMGLELGAGRVERSTPGFKLSETDFFMGFKGAYRVNRYFLMGLELSGWLQQSSDLYDPSVGEGISQIFLFAQLYPGVDSGFFIKAGGGYVSHWDNGPESTGSKSGTGLVIGAGYDFRMDSSWVITPLATYSSGNIDNEKYNATTLSVGFSYEF